MSLTPEREAKIRADSLFECVECCQHFRVQDLLAEVDRLRVQLGDAHLEMGNLRAENLGKPPLNVKASQTIPKLFDEIDQLREKLLIATEALEKIAYWKSDARTCCFPVDCYELLAKIRGEK